MTTYDLEDVARLAASGDNVAITLATLAAGTEIRHADRELRLSHDVLEGHRFALRTIEKGEYLLSWGLPFGAATKIISPGDYVCNPLSLDILRDQLPEHPFPAEANFVDASYTYQFDADTFQPADQVSLTEENRFFDGYSRPGGRGVGTRNFIAVVGVTSRVAGLTSHICSAFSEVPQRYSNIHGVVPIAHTEGGSRAATHNRELILKTLSGFVVHPNIGAVLCLDYGDEPVTGEDLRHHLESNNYPLRHVPHALLSVRGSIADTVVHARSIISDWLEPVNREERSRQLLGNVKLALQCGGSDAFSGISANPLVGRVSKEIVRHGGTACIAETTELIGAESYMLSKVRDADTAQRFLKAIEDFRELAGRHGHDPEGNPSGGNRLRGLYNIVVKSIGAALKKDPEIRLDDCLAYSQRMLRAGYVFMDTPGNDLESIAGQVAGGSNLICFTTGNGSITNFPFVPTVKFITTTGRYELVKNEMDINAGVFLEGTSMDTLTNETLEYLIGVASGNRTAGERAGHSQVQLWRNWQQDEPADFESVAAIESFSEKAIAIREDIHKGVSTALKDGCDEGQAIGLICPNSLCAGQVACLIASQLNRTVVPETSAISKFVALPHTEGCGCSAQHDEDAATRTLRGYITHPRVALAVMLEHGCEKYRNRLIEQLLKAHNVAPDQFGWASIQLDGGIKSVTSKVEDWVKTRLDARPESHAVSLSSVAFHTLSHIPDNLANALSMIAGTCVAMDGYVVVSSASTLLENEIFLRSLDLPARVRPNIDYGARVEKPGFYAMDTPTHDDTEILSGLGATGVNAICAVVPDHALQAHPFIPTIQIASTGIVSEADVDAVFSTEESAPIAERIADLMAQAYSGRYTPSMQSHGCTGFQITRGRLGVSL
jgi:altronate dehydratase